MIRRSGVTRVVFVTRRWAFKVPNLGTRKFVRGWLANQSEWRQRGRPGVCAPVATIGHLVLVMPAADHIGDPLAGRGQPWRRLSGDEGKPCSWGLFGDRWLLVDFDASPEQHPGLVGRLYWGRQERMARRWMREAA